MTISHWFPLITWRGYDLAHPSSGSLLSGSLGGTGLVLVSAEEVQHHHPGGDVDDGVEAVEVHINEPMSLKNTQHKREGFPLSITLLNKPTLKHHFDIYTYNGTAATTNNICTRVTTADIKEMLKICQCVKMCSIKQCCSI